MNLVLALVMLGGSAFMVWNGIEDPEGGPIEGLRRLVNDEPSVKRSSAIGQGFIASTVASLTAGSDGEVTQSVSASVGGSAPAGARGAILAESETWLGAPYLFGGNTKAGVDCSGFTKACYAVAGVDLARVSQAQALQGRGVSQADAQPGDLVAFGIPVHHVAIYLGAGAIRHAPHTGAVVRDESIWRSEPVFFRNVLESATPAKRKRKGKRKGKRKAGSGTSVAT